MNEPIFPLGVVGVVAEANGSTPKSASRRVPRHRLAKHTFRWLNHSRRLSKSYDCLTCIDETWIYIAMTRIMLR